MANRKLLLRRDERGQFCLHDEETGDVIAGQSSLALIQASGEPTRLQVTFLADPRLDCSVRVEGDNG